MDYFTASLLFIFQEDTELHYDVKQLPLVSHACNKAYQNFCQFNCTLGLLNILPKMLSGISQNFHV